MVQQPELDGVFGALSDPTRRAIVARLSEGEAALTELAEPFDMSMPAVSKHLRVLRDAGLVRVRADGNRRLYRSDPVRMAELRAALEAFWGERLTRMRDEVEADG